jgi:guanine deaminase
MQTAIDLSAEAVGDDAGGPFGAVVVRGDEVVGRGRNRVLVDKDPSAHAEILAIRDACRTLGDHRLAVASSTPAASPARCAWPRCTGHGSSTSSPT